MKYKVTVSPDDKNANSKLRGRVAYKGKYLRFVIARVDANDPKKWDAENKRCFPQTKHGKSKVPASIINREIEKFINAVDTFFILHETDVNEPSVDELSRYVKIKMGLEKEEAQSGSIFEHYDRFMNETGEKASWSLATVRKYKTLKNDLKGMYPSLSYADINGEFMLRFKNDLVQRKNRNGTIKKKITELKCFVEWASKKGFCPPVDDEHYEVKLKVIDRDVIFLTWEELMAVWNFKFDDNEKYLERARDLFCFLCFTGLRYSDFAKLKKDDVNYDKVNGATLKTGASIHVELNDYSRSILEKYKDYEEVDEMPSNRIGKSVKKKGLALPVISSQNLNKYIKLFAEKAGLTTPTTISYYIGPTRHDDTKPKYEWLTSHAGRRTFICTALSLNVPVTTVMSWSGHSNFESMKPYVDAAGSHRRKEMKKFNAADEVLSED